MQKFVFCKISCMKYYKGASIYDEPYNGGSFVKENGYGHEEYNFYERSINDGWIDDSGVVSAGEYCLGFVETKSTSEGKRNQLHIEKINGCGAGLKKEPCVLGVTVVWCATSNLNETTVVGWYKNATVFREYQEFKDQNNLDRIYNVIALAGDCVLLPQDTRHRHIWNVPSKKYTRTFGFGQSMLWYAQEEKAGIYLQRLAKNIEEYNGENWLQIVL